jgi:hypothetical protein
MKCPFCQQELHLLENGNERCDLNESCWYHKMPRYVRIQRHGILAEEHLVLTETIYLVINHRNDTTTISKLDVIALSDPVLIRKALKLDLSDIDKVVDKIKTLLMFS